MPPKKTSTPSPASAAGEKKTTWTDKFSDEEKAHAKAEARRLTAERKAEGKEGTVSWLSVLAEMGKTKRAESGEPVVATTKRAPPTECKGRKPKSTCEELAGCKWKSMKKKDGTTTEYCAKVASTTRALSPGRLVAKRQQAKQQAKQQGQEADYADY